MAQSLLRLCGGGFARLWFHITHLLVDGGKMSKSLGNMYTLADLDKLGHRPSAVRYVLAGGYYRRPLNFTLSSLEDAKAALNRLSKFDMQLRNASGTDSVPSYEEFCAAFPELGIFQPAWDSLNDDLNTPEALGHVFSAIRKADIPSLSPEAAARLRECFPLYSGRLRHYSAGGGTGGSPGRNPHPGGSALAGQAEPGLDGSRPPEGGSGSAGLGH